MLPAQVATLRDRVVIVTGAAGGQGAAEAEMLAAAGAQVVAADLTPGPAPAEGIHPRELDVADPEAWSALSDWVRERFGRVDGLVNNAAITSRERLGSVTLDTWRRVLDVNLTGAMLGIQAVAPVMPAGGSIVNVGSVAALVGHYPAAYTASKWGLRGLSGLASLELAPRGIRVNAIHPGYIEYADDGRCAARLARRDDRGDAAGRDGRAAGGRPPRGLPALGRGELHHRGRRGHRRRLLERRRGEGASRR